MNRLDHALAHAMAGLRVFPVWWVDDDGRCACGEADCASAGKHPIGALVAKGHLNATTTPDTIRQWWSIEPDANVGIVIPDTAVLLDTDSDEGEAAVVARCDGVVPRTLTSKTARGYHRLFRWPDGEPKPSNKSGKLKLLPGVDFKANGYFVGPGSGHQNGTTYEWVHGPEVGLMEAPDWLVARVREVRAADVARMPIAAEGEVIYEHEGRNDAVFVFMRSNRARGFAREENEAAARAFNERVCRPPLGEAEMRKIIRSATTLPDVPEFIERRQAKAELEVGIVPEIAGSSDAEAPPFPTFPVEAIVGIGGEWARLMDGYSEAPIPYLWAPFVTIFGAALAGAAVLDDGDDPPPRLYTLIIDETGGNKSHGMKKARQFFAKYVGGIVCPVFLDNRASSEGLQLGCEQAKRTPRSVVSMYDEARVFTQKIGIENSTLLDIHTTLYEDTVYGSGTKKGGIELPDVHLSLLGATVPDVFQKDFAGEAVKQGLLNRMTLVSVAERSGKSFPRVPNDPVDDLRQLAVRVRAIAKPLIDAAVGGGFPVRIPVHPDAEAVYVAWHGDIEARHGGHYRDPNVRLRGLARRMALINALMLGEREVSVEAMQAAVAFVEYQRQIRPLVSPNEGKGNAGQMEEALLRWLRPRAGQWLEERIAMQNIKPSRYGGSGVWISALRAMFESGLIERRDSPKKMIRLLPEPAARAA